MKFFIATNIFDNYSRLQILIRLKLSGHTGTPTENSNLMCEKYKRGESKNKQQYRKALDNSPAELKELPSKVLEQCAFNTRHKTEEHVLVDMDKSTHNEHLLQPLQLIIGNLK